MRVLVIEDEHKIANSIKRGLEQERYAVDVAYTIPNLIKDYPRRILRIQSQHLMMSYGCRFF